MHGKKIGLFMDSWDECFDDEFDATTMELIARERDKKPNARYAQIGYPLHFVAEYGDWKKALTLIAMGADVNQPDDNGMLALHWACRNGHLEIVHILVEAKADINWVDDSKMTPLIWAVRHGRKEVVRYLLGRRAQRIIQGVVDLKKVLETPIFQGSEEALKEITRFLEDYHGENS